MDNENYRNWRDAHKRVFGNTFDKAFANKEEAQVLLTAALIKISQRNYEAAKPQLDMLETICDNAFDETALWYFKGLNFECNGDEPSMEEYYEKVRLSGIELTVSLAFSPYYRSAKLAQKASKCKKAVYYFSKALEFYEGRTITAAKAKSVSQMLYDAATVFLYMHNYDECERFLDLSRRYDNSQNQQRDYVTATLYAVRGKEKECNSLIENLSGTLQPSCLNITQAILKGTDLHYCEVPQDRDCYQTFWLGFEENEEIIRNLVLTGDTDSASRVLSNVLTEVFEYVNRPVECKIEANGGTITVKCKNYYIKTLAEEQKALFSQMPTRFLNWKFVTVEE